MAESKYDDEGNLVGEKYKPIVREVEAVGEKVKTTTLAELRKLADDLGISHKGLKKPELQAAVEAKQAEPPSEPAVETETPAVPANGEESA